MRRLFSLLTVGILLGLFSLIRALPARSLSSSELEPYIYTVPSVTYNGNAPDIVEKIRRQVHTIVQSDNHTHLIGARIWGTANQLLWGHGKAVTSLAQSLPYLDSADAGKLKNYLSSDVTTYLLSQTHLQSEIAGSIGKSQSLPRYGIAWSDNYAFCYDALYGIWAYGHYAKDDALIRSKWGAIQSVYSLCQKGDRRYLGTAGNPAFGTYTSGLNSKIAGTIAMVRMAVIAGDQQKELAAKNAALSLLNEKSSAVTNASNNPVKLMGSALGRFLYIDGYQDLTIDLSRFLKDKHKQKISSQFAFVTDRFQTWFLSDFDHVSDWMSVAPFAPVTDKGERPGEEGYQMSLFAHPIFLSLAYIGDVPTTRLRKELPFAQNSLSTPSSFDMFRLDYTVAIANKENGLIWK